MTPSEMDELCDEDFAAMVRLMALEAEEIARANRKH
jgi:hypothetical protein